VFTLELPYSDAQPSTLRRASEAGEQGAARSSALILVVDDETTIQVAMKDLLEGWGFKTMIAGSCDALLEKLAHCPDRPGLIICDYRLRAHENGIHVIERLRSEYNDDEIPGMLITGDTAPDRLKEAQESGLLLLHKPVSNSRLRAAIMHLLVHRAVQPAHPAGSLPPASD
jgi:CheY-like chemotaxis protein